jgi:hypothetical protein
MVKTYQGYFQEDGRFVPDGILAKVPSRRRAVVNVFVEEIADATDQRREQRNAFEEFFAAMEVLNDDEVELLDYEFDAIIAERVNITRELDL